MDLNESTESLRKRFFNKWNTFPEKFEREIMGTGMPIRAAFYPTIIIPSYKCPEYLELCLEGIDRNSTIPYELRISIQKGDEDSKKVCENFSGRLCKNFRFLQTREGSLSKQINMLAKVAETDYIFYIHDDCYPLPKWLENMGRVVNAAFKELAYLTPTLIEPISEGPHPNFVIQNYGETRADFERDQLEKEWFVWISKDKKPCPPGAWVMNTDSFLRTGGKDEMLYLYGEDSEFMMRLWATTQDPEIFVQVGDCLLYHFASKAGTNAWNKRPDDQIDEEPYIYHKFGMSIADFEYKILKRGEIYTRYMWR